VLHGGMPYDPVYVESQGYEGFKVSAQCARLLLFCS